MSLPIERYGFIGNMVTSALVGADGSIDWMCVPHFDSGACFAALLGTSDNGRWLIAPRDKITGTSRRYRGETMILETRFETATGAVTVIAGLVMISRSRGYGLLLVGEWGVIVVSSIALAVVMGAIGDAGMRPAIRRLDPDVPGGVAAVRRWALAGLILGAIAVLLMTRAIYAR